MMHFFKNQTTLIQLEFSRAYFSSFFAPKHPTSDKKIPKAIIVTITGPSFSTSNTRTPEDTVKKNVKSAVRWKRMRAIFIKELKSFRSLILRRQKKCNHCNIYFCLFFTVCLQLKAIEYKKGKPYIMITKKFVVHARERERERKESNKVKKKKSF